MEKTINIIASTQPNKFSGIDEYEGKWAKKVTDILVPLLQKRGWKVTAPWEYDANGNLNELQEQIATAKEQNSSFTISIHADACGPDPAGILMIVPNAHPEYKTWATILGKKLGALTGLGYKNTVDETYTNVKALAVFRRLTTMPNILIEIGNMSNPEQAAWLRDSVELIAKSLAAAIDDSIAEVYGTLTPPSPTPTTDTAYKTYRITPAQRRGEKPYSRGSDCAWMQRQLKAIKIYPDMEVDGIYGPITEKAIKVFQKNKGLVVDGECGPLTWKALLTS